MTANMVKKMETSVIIYNMMMNHAHGTNKEMKLYLNELENRGIIKAFDSTWMLMNYKNEMKGITDHEGID